MFALTFFASLALIDSRIFLRILWAVPTVLRGELCFCKRAKAWFLQASLDVMDKETSGADFVTKIET
jgi:hypothetical protein